MKTICTCLISFLIYFSPVLASQFSSSSGLEVSQVDVIPSHVPTKQVGKKERRKSYKKQKALLKKLLIEKVRKEDRQAKLALRLVLAGLISIGISSLVFLTILILLLSSTAATFTGLTIFAAALTIGGFLSMLIGGFLGLAASNRLKKQGGEKADLKRANLAKGLGLAFSAATILSALLSLITES